jgi:hypothetical protein
MYYPIYTVTYSGVDGEVHRHFATLKEVQIYCRDRWEGLDYMDNDHQFHNDYGRFTLEGCNLFQLGRQSLTDEYSWVWKEL